MFEIPEFAVDNEISWGLHGVLARFLCFSCCFHPKYGQEFRSSYNPFISFFLLSLPAFSSTDFTDFSFYFHVNKYRFLNFCAVFPIASGMIDSFASFLCCRVCPAIPSCRSVLTYLFTCLQTLPVRGSLSCGFSHSFFHHILLFSQLNSFSPQWFCQLLNGICNTCWLLSLIVLLSGTIPPFNYLE